MQNQAEKLVFSDLNSVFTSSNCGWNLATVTQCGATDLTEFSNQSAMGFFGLGATTSSKVYTGIPPHWSLSVRFDLILYLTLDPNDLILVQIDQNSQNNDGYTKDAFYNGYKTCIPSNQFGDELVLYYRNITHTDSNLKIVIQSITDQSISDEGFGFRNFYIYVDTCHDSCLTCNGPTATQCLTCPPNSTQNGNTCTCISGYYAQNNSCIQTCQPGFIQDSTGKLCVQDFCYAIQCQSCQNGLCTQCQPGFYLLNGQCLANCPSFSTQTGQQCVDLITQINNGSYLLKSMFNTYFSESEIVGSGLTTFGFLGFINTSSRALTTVCNGYSLLGGAYLSSQNSYIQRKFTGLQPHWQVIIGYTLYKIDSWNNENVQLIVDENVIVTTQRNINDGVANICGRVSINDQIIKIQQTFTHASSSLSLLIKSNLNSDPFTESYGIRELYVLVDYCSPNCITCNAQGCIKCQSNYYLYNFKCNTVCPSGYAPDSNQVCQLCDLSCQTCSKPQDNTSCLSCNPNHYLNPNKTCQNTCPSSYWKNNSNWQCSACDSTCFNCQSPGDSNSCTSCSGYRFLTSNKCLINCPSNTFPNIQTNNNICQPCDSSCKTCDGPNSNNCLSCNAPQFFLQSTKTCVLSCNPNQYKNISNQTCSSCDYSCSTCSGPSYTNCLSCSGNTFLYQNQCIANCPVKYFNNASNNQCTACDYTCQQCNGTAPNNCLSCQLPRYFDPTSNSCLMTCNSNQYHDLNSNLCKQCDSLCLTCNGPLISNCTSCRQGLFLQNNICKPICDGSYYGETLTNTCNPCDSTCLTCDGPNSNNCLSCQAPNLFYQQGSKTCVTQCNSNQFKNTANQTCSLCDSSCSTCQGPSYTNCLSCTGNTYLYQNQCILNCPSNYYGNNQNKQCTQCDPTCYLCNGGANNNCLSCQNGRYLDQTLKQCVLNCNSNQYVDANSGQCMQCHSSCQTCNGPLISNCKSCKSGLFLQDSQCKPICDGSYFGDVMTNTCQPCFNSCKTCDGPNNNNCLSCLAPSLFFQQSSKTCVSTCEINQFKNTNNQSCSSCHSTCSTCSGPNDINCLSCQANSFLYQNQCLSSCPIKYYGNTQNNQCSPCDPTCQTCNGSGSNNCLSCQLQRYFDPKTNQCVQICDSNQYPDINSDSCKQCDSSCLTCSGPSSSDCASCEQGTFLQNGQCIQTCDDSYYMIPQSNICQKCDLNCKTCTGTSQFECLSCSPSLFFLKNACLTDCPENYYPDLQQQECFECHQICKQGCSGPLQEDCFSIKYQYQIILYILACKSFIWIVSTIIGYLQDKQQSQIFIKIVDQPHTVDSDSPSKKSQQKDNDQTYFDRYINQQSPKKINIEQSFNFQQQQQQLDQTQIQQLQTNQNLDNKIIKTKRRPRKIIHKNIFYERTQTFKDICEANFSQGTPNLVKSISKMSSTNFNLISSSLAKDEKDLDKQEETIQQPLEKYIADQKLKFTIVNLFFNLKRQGYNLKFCILYNQNQIYQIILKKLYIQNNTNTLPINDINNYYNQILVRK
ncbi:zinc finger lsd1 subclass family protein (macronuclear) [Tetrahymena thermophila SB210]|uniref:Zinc finger lsd1 subclass family protein n=1 Tax=Tetrahymena thermophila (strain SB210) TaxID=312017 RepID=Q22Z15_TETTS|nr:zinc finger lsd1 subclass family protein [Tetrahymena thermophila SB210]EAR90506.3 zinc finger lsd1 subclass family protein [Tetrahymena thermophila SB210]|eukprot:XP_001010751.3 zinc finger lsd1 subclass family protein [Tetrahymena thermophila SB210]